MIELVIKNYMDKHLDTPCFLERPENPPEEYVLFEKTGGSAENQLFASTFAFQSYAPSLYKAAELNDKVKACVDQMIILGDVASVKLNSDYNFTDSTTKQYRYQAIFDIKHY